MNVPEMQPPVYPDKGSCSLRKGRSSLSGHYYFIRTSTADQNPLFLEKQNCQIVFEAIKWLTDNQRWECFCAMIMPDHLHLVARLIGDWSLDRVMQLLKGYTARRINQLNGTAGQIWQDGYYEHCIRTELALRKIILYCYYNPVRKGLVQRPQEYPYWWCKYRL